MQNFEIIQHGQEAGQAAQYTAFSPHTWILHWSACGWLA